MDKIGRAIYIAAKFHGYTPRKSEVEIPMLFHPFTVGMMLERSGCDQETVIAGILHDTVEDTVYTLKEIENEFGSVVAKYVSDVSEPSKTLSWEERKEYSIAHMKNASLSSKLISACDKINNLESLYRTLENEGECIWSSFKRGREQQEWYYKSMYESIIYGKNENHELFLRLKNIMSKVFS